MGRRIDYKKQTIETPNPVARYAQMSRFQKSVQIAERHLKPSGTMLDFGCGQGTFLNMISLRRSDVELLGYDPQASVHTGRESFKIITDIASIDKSSVDLVVAFEVLEHLTNPEMEEFTEIVQTILSKDGTLLISVPIIGGPTILMKEINRMILFRRKTDYAFGELMQCAFFGKAATRTDNVKTSHKGFDFRSLQQKLERDFSIETICLSPFPHLPWYLNSQIFWKALPGNSKEKKHS